MIIEVPNGAFNSLKLNGLVSSELPDSMKRSSLTENVRTSQSFTEYEKNENAPMGFWGFGVLEGCDP